METEGSLPQLQVSATCPYPEPSASSPYSHFLLPKDPSQYYPSTYACVSQVVLFYIYKLSNNLIQDIIHLCNKIEIPAKIIINYDCKLYGLIPAYRQMMSDYRQQLVFPGVHGEQHKHQCLCCSPLYLRFPEDGVSVPKHVGVF